MTKILVACEESQTVTTALRAVGLEAYSCDLQNASGGHPEWHIQSDVIDVLHSTYWDVVIGFPPCTYLASSGMHWTTRGLRDPKLTENAVKFAKTLYNYPSRITVIENPIGVLSTRLRKPDQIIQPWMFGHDASKQTCLWLKGAPPLVPTLVVPPTGYVTCQDDTTCTKCGQEIKNCTCGGIYKKINGHLFYSESCGIRPVWGNQTPSGQNKLGPSPERPKLRSKTYEGIAAAMATQWKDYITNEH